MGNDYKSKNMNEEVDFNKLSDTELIQQKLKHFGYIVMYLRNRGIKTIKFNLIPVFLINLKSLS